MIELRKGWEQLLDQEVKKINSIRFMWANLISNQTCYFNLDNFILLIKLIKIEFGVRVRA